MKTWAIEADRLDYFLASGRRQAVGSLLRTYAGRETIALHTNRKAANRAAYAYILGIADVARALGHPRKHFAFDVRCMAITRWANQLELFDCESTEKKAIFTVSVT